MKIIKMVDLPQLPQEAKALLEVIGCLQVRSLAVKDPDILCADLAKANAMLKINTRNPELSDVKKWVLSAIEEVGEEPVSESCDKEDLEEVVSEARHEEPPTVKIDAKNDAEITERLQLALVAERLDPHLIRKHNIAVLDIPQAILISECEGRVEIRDMQCHADVNELTADDGSGIQAAESSAAQKVSASLAPLEGSKVKLNDEAGFRDFDSVNKGEHHIKPLDRGGSEVSNVNPDLNKNVKSNSRRYIKGVLHADPSRIKIPAFFVILLQVSLVITVIGLPCLLILRSEEKGNTVVAIALLGTLLVSIILYLTFAAKSSCRVCGQKQFIPKYCIKHKKAHYSSFLGYMLPTALQAILYHWFYCIYCGTAIRLKK